MTEEMKICPYCGSEIPQYVQKCKYCGEWLVLQEKDRPKANFHISAILEGIIVVVILLFMCFGSYSTGAVVTIFGLYVLLNLYFLPTLIADGKRTQYTGAILALNLLLGLTLIVWVGCLVWALMLPDLSKNQAIDSNLPKKSLNVPLNKINDSDSNVTSQQIVDNKERLSPNIQNKFNWGAFWTTWIWGLFNKSYKTFYTLIPFFGIIWMFVCGIKGNEWAWKNKKWSGEAEFEQVQYKWAMYSNIVAAILITLFLSLLIASASIKDESVIIQNAVEKYNKEQITENAKKFGVSKKCAEDYLNVLKFEGVAEGDFLQCTKDENIAIKNYWKKEAEKASNQEYTGDYIEPLYTNNGMPKSLVLKDVPIMCFEKANLGDNSSCTKKQLNTIKQFFEENKNINWESEYFEY